MEWSHVETYLKRAQLVWDESNPRNLLHQLIVPDTIEHWLYELDERFAAVREQNGQLSRTEDFDPGIYSCSVPELSEDGYCTRIGELSSTPYDLRVRLGGESVETSRFLRSLQDIVQISFDTVKADWLGIYGRFSAKGQPDALVKLAYRGIPSRPEFPLTELFATKSNNSKVGLTGAAVIINNLEVHLRKGGAYYVCDDMIKSEVCLPIFSSDFSKVIGIVDAESTEVYHFKALPLSALIALCVHLTGIFEDTGRW